MHGQLADVAAREKERANDVGIGGEGQPFAAGQGEGGGVVHRVQQRIRKGGGKHTFDQVVRRLAAAAVAQGDMIIAQVKLVPTHLPHALDLVQNEVFLLLLGTGLIHQSVVVHSILLCTANLPVRAWFALRLVRLGELGESRYINQLTQPPESKQAQSPASPHGWRPWSSGRN